LLFRGYPPECWTWNRFSGGRLVHAPQLIDLIRCIVPSHVCSASCADREKHDEDSYSWHSPGSFGQRCRPKRACRGDCSWGNARSGCCRVRRTGELSGSPGCPLVLPGRPGQPPQVLVSAATTAVHGIGNARIPDRSGRSDKPPFICRIVIFQPAGRGFECAAAGCRDVAARCRGRCRKEELSKTAGEASSSRPDKVETRGAAISRSSPARGLVSGIPALVGMAGASVGLGWSMSLPRLADARARASGPDSDILALSPCCQSG